MKKLAYVLFIPMFFVSILSIQGCVLLAGAAVGGGSVAYKLGKLEHNVDANVNQVHQAALTALDRLDMFVTSEGILSTTSQIVAETVDGKKVKIDIQELTARASKIEIRVGTIGNEEKSHMILGAIQKQL